MRQKIAKIVLLAFCLVFLVAPLMSRAAEAPSIFPSGYWAPNGLLACSGSDCTFDNLIQTVINFIYFGITLVIFVFSPVLFAFGGITMMISAGNPANFDKGKKILTGTAVGLIITVAAYLIVKLFLSFVKISGVQGF